MSITARAALEDARSSLAAHVSAHHTVDRDIVLQFAQQLGGTAEVRAVREAFDAALAGGTLSVGLWEILYSHLWAYRERAARALEASLDPTEA